MTIISLFQFQLCLVSWTGWGNYKLKTRQIGLITEKFYGIDKFKNENTFSWDLSFK